MSPPPGVVDKRPPRPRTLPKIINGGIAGIIGVTIVFPLDLVKTRIQNQTIGPNGEKQYSSIIATSKPEKNQRLKIIEFGHYRMDCFKKTYAKEGYFGMYRGSAVNIILITPEKAIKLTMNDLFRYHLTSYDGVLTIPRQMLAGGGAGACQMVITTPMELLKIKMQDQGQLKAETEAAGKKFQSITVIQLIKQILKERGFFGLYTGVLPTVCRDVTFSIVYFPGYACISNAGPKTSTGATPFWWSFVAGCTAGCCAAVFATPIDVVKTRMQARGHLYSSLTDCVKKTAMEGPTAFFKGGACRAMVGAPLFGIAQTVYYIGLAGKVFGIK